MYIPQWHLKNIDKFLLPQKVLIVYGPRRCGKTTFIKHVIEGASEDHLLVSGEDITVQEYLSSQSIEKLRSFVGGKRFLLIDEAQKIKNIGLNLKLLIDHVEGLKIIATGSSAFDLARHTGEPLTGRKITIKMFPLAQMELNNVESSARTSALLDSRLVYGSYPEIITCDGDQQRVIFLREIVGSYLYKDILELEGIRHADKLVKLLRCLAFQIGKEVSYTELGTQLGMSKNTVEKYLELLEKAFVVFRLGGFSRNLRKEISKNPRYYFYDVGIRNAIINNFNPLSARDDVGMLWENYIISERLKKQGYLPLSSNNYFWRTYDRKEVDWVEERDGKLFGYEVKWSAKKAATAAWNQAYPEAQSQMVTRENYLEFIT